MAERSFVQEVQKLRLGDGDEFHGEGILAVTKALLQSGVSYVAGYQGAPISHLMDVLTDANDILQELGVHFEHSASEATAAATLAASVNYPLRGAVTFKSTVGTNVASDALANLASGGVTGGAMLIVGEDYGEGSSIMQERSHAFAMKSQVWLIDPRPNLPSIVHAVEKGFELSEASNTPVMLELRIRACHVHGRFPTRDNVRPNFTLKDAIENPKRDVNRIVLPPASYLHEQEKTHTRWPAAVKFIQEHQLNEFFSEDAQDFGIVMQGGQGDIKHWAFNDPVKRTGKYKTEPPTPAEYRKLSTRVVELHPVTLAQNARTSGGGNITMVPKMAITVGPKETWMAEKVSIWQAGLHDNPLGQRLTALMISKRIADSSVPMSLLADHPNVQFNYFRNGLGSCAVEMH